MLQHLPVACARLSSARHDGVIRVPPLTLAPLAPEGAANNCVSSANVSGPCLGAHPLKLAVVSPYLHGLFGSGRDSVMG